MLEKFSLKDLNQRCLPNPHDCIVIGVQNGFVKSPRVWLKYSKINAASNYAYKENLAEGCAESLVNFPPTLVNYLTL